MTVNYRLNDYELSDDPDDYRAIIEYAATADQDDILNRMAMGPLTVSKKQAAAIIDSYFEAIYSFTVEGFKVNTPYFNVGLKIKGLFKTINDVFDSKRHKVDVYLSPSAKSRKSIVKKVHFKKVVGLIVKPEPFSFFDQRSQLKDAVATPGGTGRLSGSGLKFKATDVKQGIFFVAPDNTEFRVDPLDVAQNSNKLLLFTVPLNLPPNDYKLEVRKGYGANLRRGELTTKLSVSA